MRLPPQETKAVIAISPEFAEELAGPQTPLHTGNNTRYVPPVEIDKKVEGQEIELIENHSSLNTSISNSVTP